MQTTPTIRPATDLTTVAAADIVNVGSQQQGQASDGTCSAPQVEAMVYRVEEIAKMLCISLRSAYNLCNTTKEFRVIRIHSSIRVSKASFDGWFRQNIC